MWREYLFWENIPTSHFSAFGRPVVLQVLLSQVQKDLEVLWTYQDLNCPDPHFDAMKMGV